MPQAGTVPLEVRAEIKRLHSEEKMSILAISHRFTISPNTVRHHLGLNPKRGKKS